MTLSARKLGTLQVTKYALTELIMILSLSISKKVLVVSLEVNNTKITIILNNSIVGKCSG